MDQSPGLVTQIVVACAIFSVWHPGTIDGNTKYHESKELVRFFISTSAVCPTIFPQSSPPQDISPHSS
jgi:hypothetical protein